MNTDERIYVGTCGFSYKEWVGPFYPHGLPQEKMLEFYAERFSAVEIDSTYYAIPKPALFAAMARRTPDGFRFTVKAPGSVTHLPTGTEPTRKDLAAFRACLQPLIDADKLGAVLLQFPNAFRPGPHPRERLEQLRAVWSDLPLVAEFRHRDWQQPRVHAALRALRLGWCNVDQPHIPGLLLPSAEVTADVGYVRFHGRSSRTWYKGGDSGERYNYRYGVDEIGEWLPRIERIAERAKETYVFFNNHRLGKAAFNARELRNMLAGKPADAPDGPGELTLFGEDLR